MSGKVLVGLVQIISRLDSQSKFQMLTIFSGGHVGGAKSSTNVAAPKWAFQGTSEVWENAQA